jgi:hypothetical protein
MTRSAAWDEHFKLDGPIILSAQLDNAHGDAIGRLPPKPAAKPAGSQ